MPLPPIGPAPGALPISSGPPAGRFGELLRAQAAQASGPAAPPATEAAAHLLQAVDRARARLDAVLAEARRGRSFAAGELLALQADAYRAGQTLELASRVVEQGAQAIRQAVNTQV